MSSNRVPPDSPPGAEAPAASLAASLLAWYDRHRRILPWRAPPGTRPDPYRVWLSEVMLQQTTVAAVDGYFRRFLERWPGFAALAAADTEAVMQAWAGLGYYARARNLHRCAREVVERHGGHLPQDEAELRQLPGIGAYTAAAIAAIAFDRKATAVDGNVERVIARLCGVTEPLPRAKPALTALAAGLVPAERPGDYTQALMDLGATLCTPRRPKCTLCPWRDPCAARRAGIAEGLPARAPKPERPTRRGIAFWAVTPQAAVLLRRRPEHGLLGGMMEVPSSAWEEAESLPALAAVAAAAPLPAAWRLLPGQVRHVFTHFALELAVAAARVEPGLPAGAGGRWVPLEALEGEALPSVMKKVVRHALAHAVQEGQGA